MNKMAYLSVKVYKNNFMATLSNNQGQVIFKLTSGCLGFKNIQKRGVEALKSLIDEVLKKFVFFKKVYLYFKMLNFKACKNIIFKNLLSACSKNKINIIVLTHINKVSHNGCRKKKLKLK